MKSLFSIVKNLSDKEVTSFKRLFLSGKKSGENRKRELFDAVLKSRKQSDFEKFVRSQHYSRQNYYQLSRRLRENLYDFLFSFHNAKRDDERLSEEMECHKKLYCVKMLLDRNMPEQAQQVLEEAISASEKYQLRDIYFEALNLKNMYFPLADQPGPSSNVKFRYIKDIRDNLGKNEYIREYMVASVSENHECDILLRERLITFIEQHYSGTDNEVIAHFLHVNHLFKERKFESAYLYLKALGEIWFDQSVQPDIAMQGLICLELAKASICLDRSKEALNFLQHVETHLNHLDYWKAVIYELKFVIALRSGEGGKQMSILTAVKKLCLHVNCEQHQRRWNLYSAWYHYMNKDFKEVIKYANDRGTQVQSSQQEQVILKVMELMSIHLLQDHDWFYYKSESLRKQITGRTDVTERLSAQFTILKKYIHCDQDGAFEKLEEIENQYPWHPLSHELINLNQLMASQVATPAAKQLQYSEQ